MRRWLTWTALPLAATGLLVSLPLPGHAAPPQGLVLEGRLLDSEAKLRAALGLEGGCAQGLPHALEDRVKSYLDALGYEITELRCANGHVRLRVRPYRVIRKIYVKGNWPIFEEEILRRLSFRPGQRLPEGEALARALARQEERMRVYLSREGYFDGSLRIRVVPASAPDQANLEVRLLKGKRYKVGDVLTEVVQPPVRRAADRPALAVTRDEITRRFLHKTWFYKRTFNTQRFNEDAEQLTQRFHDLGYPGVRIKHSYEVVAGRRPEDAVRIRLAIQQRKRIQVSYEGNQRISRADLNQALTIFNEGAYDDYELTQSTNNLRRLYQSRGYLQARIRFTRTVSRDVDHVTFYIHEGPRLAVREVQFVGNRTVDAERLRKVIKTRPFPLLGWIGLGEGGYLTDTQLKQDTERIIAFYHDLGFSEVKVAAAVSPHPTLFDQPGALAAVVGAGTEANGDLYVRFSIEEGQRAVVEQVYCEGNKLVGSRELLGQLELKRLRPFSEKALQLDKARLARIYGEKGYPYAEVQSFEEANEERTKVSVQFTVQENQPVRFGEVFIRGNFKTRSSVILGDLGFRRGDRFDISLIERAETRLRKRELFNMVRIQLLGLAEHEAEVPVLVSVEERYDDHGAIELGVGGSTDNLLFGSLAYNNRNVLGFGTSVSLKGEIGMEIQSGTLHYRDPRLFGTTLILDAQGYLRLQDTERFGQVRTFGGTLSLSKELVAHLQGLLRYEIRQVKHREPITRPPGVDENWQIDVLTRTGGIGPALVYDRRDNPLSPTRGIRLEGSLLWATPYLGGTQPFLKFNVSGQAFIPLPKSITIACAVRYDHGYPLGGDVQLPKVERYFAGGDTTIRGLEEDMAWAEVVEGPLGLLPGTTLLHVRPQGGNIRVLTNLELQFPIWQESILFGLPLMGAVFLDNGVVTNSFHGFELSDFRHGAGLALRVVTPVGFSSFEYAWALDPQVWDPKLGRFHFNFGFVF